MKKFTHYQFRKPKKAPLHLLQKGFFLFKQIN